MTDAAKDSRKDLKIAITELILDLKRDGTLMSLADKIDIPRNRLTLIFMAYKNQRTNEHLDRCLDWRIAPLEMIADKLKIRVSDLIRAAEDIQDGLPPWFQFRISSNDTQPQSKEELTHVFLEAFGCRSYGTPDPLAVKGQRKSLRYCPSNLFSGVEVSNLKFYAECLLELSALSDFVEAYFTNEIKNKDAYRILKKAVAKVICDDEVTPLLEQLHKKKTNLIDAINREHHCFLQGRNC